MYIKEYFFWMPLTDIHSWRIKMLTGRQETLQYYYLDQIKAYFLVHTTIISMNYHKICFPLLPCIKVQFNLSHYLKKFNVILKDLSSECFYKRLIESRIYGINPLLRHNSARLCVTADVSTST